MDDSPRQTTVSPLRLNRRRLVQGASVGAAAALPARMLSASDRKLAWNLWQEENPEATPETVEDMTNDPPFDQQLEHLREFERTGEVTALPGSNDPDARFVRAAYYHQHLPHEESERRSVAALMSVMRNTAAPFGLTSDGRPDVSTTRWRTIMHLPKGTIYYDSVVSPSVFWVDAYAFDYREDNEPKKLQVVENYDLAGDVTNQFIPAEMFHFAPASE